MNKYVKLAVGAGVFCLVIFGASALYNKLLDKHSVSNEIVTQGVNESVISQENVKNQNIEENKNEQETAENVKAMDFKIINSEGEQTSLFSFVGKPIVINFWASWCGPCKNELPDFQAAYEKYGEDVEFLMVNMTDGMRETIDVAKEYIKSAGYTFPLYFDTTTEAAYTYAVYSIPMTFFIDADGNIAAYAQGMIDAKTLEEGIGLIFEK